MIRLRLAGEQAHDRGREIVGDRAADAAVGKLDDRVFRASRVRATLDEIAINPDVAEFVDDERKAPPAGVGQKMADQRGLAGAEKAGDDGDGRLGEHPGSHLSNSVVSAGASGGVRETTPLRKASGRSRQGTIPTGEAA